MGNGTERARQTPPAGEAPRRWSFGAAALDERSMKLFVEGRVVELELKPLELLRYLLRHAGEAVGKEDLVKAVWPGRVISDSALTSTVAKLREALGESGDSIRTVHGFGYRLEAEVRVQEREEPRGEPAGPQRAQPSRRLAAIMFTDLVGYSALAHRDEALAIELLELHRGWVREILPRHGGIEIETVGDAFLVEFSGALAAVECALAIQQRFADHNASAPENRRMQLRIGVHLGDIEHKDGKVMGDGVNIASRIHGEAEPGGICVSEDIHRAVRNRGFGFHELGSPDLKNIETPMALYALDDGATLVPGRWRWLRRKRHAVVVGAAAGAAALLGVLGLRLLAPSAPPDKSVAVLPFENLSAEPDSGYFADGVHDSVIAHLARIKDLKTISRTSVMQYRSAARKLREIGRALGVAHVVEGTVQRAGRRVRVTAQLIKVADDQHIWAESYDRDLADIFGIQTEIARHVAENIQARLSDAVVGTIARRPTSDPEAYDLYLRALRLHHEEITEGNSREGLALAQRAIERDPEFALGHALVSLFYSKRHWVFNEPGSAQRARRAAEKSLSLRPDLAEAHLALARALYWGERDYAGALAALERAGQLAPGNAEVPRWSGFVQRRQGQWDAALAQLEQAAVLDPVNDEVVTNYADMLSRMRRYEDAERIYDQAIALGNRPDRSRVEKAYVTFLRTGDVNGLVAFLRAPASDARLSSVLYRYHAALFAHDFEWATQVAREYPETTFPTGVVQPIPTDSVLAIAYDLAGDAAGVARHSAKAANQLRKQLADGPHLTYHRIYLAFALQQEGQREQALAEARRALRDLERLDDPIEKPLIQRDLAFFFAYIGEDDTALELLGESLKVPFGIHVQEARHHPFFDRLRGDPRFQKLMGEDPPKT